MKKLLNSRCRCSGCPRVVVVVTKLSNSCNGLLCILSTQMFITDRCHKVKPLRLITHLLVEKIPKAIYVVVLFVLLDLLLRYRFFRPVISNSLKLGHT